jgi:putative ABC transport system permease protein
MKIIVHVHEGLRNLYSFKLRSLLALLGILVGTASVVAMVSSGKLATNEALKQFKTLGTELLAISISDNDQYVASDNNLTLEQASGLLKADKNILIVSPYALANHPIIFEDHEIDGSILGITEEFANVAHVEIEQGRFISNLDGQAFYCVIGQSIYNKILEISSVSPIGQQIQIGKSLFTIIGIAKSWPENNFLLVNIDDTIMVPVYASATLNKYTIINNILMRLDPSADIDNVKNNIENILQQYHLSQSFTYRSAKELISHMAKQNEIFTVFLGLIGSISLLVGGIGVMNIMLVSIIERKREIGIRRAVGATPADIRALFLIEAIMLSILGGILGAIIGIVIAYIIALCWHWQFTLFLLPPIIGFSVSAATGVFFGFYPAHKASQLDPIESLRS